MVSGLVTSPCDQLRIFSGDARLMRIASKSAIVFCISNGLERNKVFLRFLLSERQYRVPSCEYRANCKPCPANFESSNFAERSCQSFSNVQAQVARADLNHSVLATRDSELIRCRAGRGLFLPGLDQLHIQAERLQFADQHVERLRHARLHGSFALDDGFVNLGAAVYVVGLRRQQLLQDEGCAVSFERPDFHFAEALAAELRLAAQRL